MMLATDASRERELLSRLDTVLAAARAVRGAGSPSAEHDERGDLCRLVEPDGRATTFGYDEQRRLARVTHPDGGLTTYTYGPDDRLAAVDDRGIVSRYRYDAAGRLTTVQPGRSGAVRFRYDEAGRLVEARAGAVLTRYGYRPGAVTVSCDSDGVRLAADLVYDAGGRLRRIRAAGVELRYTWDEDGRLLSIERSGRPIVGVEYPAGGVRLHFAGGTVERRALDPVDGRPLALSVSRGGRVLAERRYEYRADGRLAGDGARRYEYDSCGRLVTTGEPAARPDGVVHDAHGRLVARHGPGGEVGYRYDDAGRLVEARRDGAVVGRFAYDHAGRLVRAAFPGRVERYLYAPDGTLLAVADGTGAPLRIPLCTPLGVLGEVRPDGVRYRHADHTGTVLLVTGEDGWCQEAAFDPHGQPLSTPDGAAYRGRVYHPEVGLYDAGFRWYDPMLRRFLTPDTHTGRPDDARLVHPFGTGRRQVAERAQWQPAWLTAPHGWDLYAYCDGDPVNRHDPDGHWSFGWLLLSLLGAVWALPNTLFGVALEISCLVGEPLRWLLAALDRAGSWQPVGFDVAASSRLNAFALVFAGGWMGTLGDGPARFQAITFGNVFFLNRNHTMPREQLYEHELRHTNQYGWFGPLFPIVYLLDYLAHGYDGSWLERDAREQEGV